MTWDNLPERKSNLDRSRELLKNPEKLKAYIISIVLVFVGLLLLIKLIPIIGRII